MKILANWSFPIYNCLTAKRYTFLYGKISHSGEGMSLMSAKLDGISEGTYDIIYYSISYCMIASR